MDALKLFKGDPNFVQIEGIITQSPYSLGIVTELCETDLDKYL